MDKKYLTTLVLALVCHCGLAQQTNFQFTNIRINEKMDNLDIKQMLQDSRGFIWICTSEGLLQYNGRNFTLYKRDENDTNSISHNSTRDIVEDKDGYLWVATSDGGINRFDPRQGTFHRFLHDSTNTNSLVSNYTSSLAYDTSGVLWIGTYGQGINKLDLKTGKFSLLVNEPNNPRSLSSNMIHHLFMDSDGELWAISQPGISRINPETNQVTTYRYSTKPDSLTDDYMYRIYEYPEKTLWFGGHNINTFDKNANKFERLLIDDQIPGVQSIAGSNNGLWLATINGLVLYNPKDQKLQFFYSAGIGTILGNIIADVLVDKNQSLWLGINGLGFSILQSDKNFISSFTGNPIRCITQVIPNQIHVASFTDNLFIYDITNKKITTMPKPLGGTHFPYNRVTTILNDSLNRTWIGTYGDGLLCYDKTTQHSAIFRTDINNIKGNQIQFVFEDQQHTIWIGHDGGLCSYNETTQKMDCIGIDPAQNSMVPGGLQSLAVWQQNADTIWFGTWNGLTRLTISSRKFEHYLSNNNDKNSLSSNNVISLYGEQDSILWIGTYTTGLDKYNLRTKTFTHYNMKNGLPSNCIYSILPDQSGNLWLGTNNGLVRFNKKTHKIRTYTTNDGLPTNEFSWGAAYKALDGKLYFGTTNGMIAFYPDQIRDNQNLPSVYITGLRLFDQRQKPKAGTELPADITLLDELTLSYNNNMITFEFAAPIYTHTEGVKYSYKLEGFDENWRDGSELKEATYTNLPPDTYIFKVQASDNDGNVSPVRELKLIITPPFWQTWWFILSVIFTIVVLIWLYIKQREKSLKKMNLLLENTVGERTAELKNKAEQLAAAHDNLENIVKERTTELETKAEQLQQSNQALEKQKTEIENTLHTLQTTQKKLVEAEKMASLGNLVAGVAHEINTPVGVAITSISTVINDIKELVAKYENGDMAAKDFETYVQMFYDGNALALKNLERTAQLVRSFKQISLDQHSEQERKFNLNDYLHDILASINPEFKHTQIKIAIDCPPDLVINSYPGAFAQIFTNLLTNSKRHGFRNRNEGQINIVVKRENDKLHITYTDNGHGIPEKVLPRIFDPFFTTDMQGGTGLGLNILYNLVTQKLGGEIRCESKEGEGVKFLMTL